MVERREISYTREQIRDVILEAIEDSCGKTRFAGGYIWRKVSEAARTAAEESGDLWTQRIPNTRVHHPPGEIAAIFDELTGDLEGHRGPRIQQNMQLKGFSLDVLRLAEEKLLGTSEG